MSPTLTTAETQKVLQTPNFGLKEKKQLRQPCCGNFSNSEISLIICQYTTLQILSTKI